MSQPVTTNPLLIMLINMTIVFSVLFGLSLIIRIIKAIDPTQKKNVASTSSAPAPAPAAVAAPVAAAVVQDDSELVAVIAAAVAAYGYSSQIAFIRRTDGGYTWSQAGRLAPVNARSQMYN